MNTPSIPVIDMNDYYSPDDDRKAKFIKTLGDALVDLGFFAVENHGVDLDLVKKSYEINEDFFTLPDAVKKKKVS